GVRSFARLPITQSPQDVEAAIVGIPYDTGTGNRPGARFGPEGIRAASMLLRPYHPELEVQVFGSLSVVGWGDLVVTPGNAVRTADQIAEGLEPLLAKQIAPIVLGGDHSISLGELRAYAEAFGPMSLVLIDAHSDSVDSYYGTERYMHGTPF